MNHVSYAAKLRDAQSRRKTTIGLLLAPQLAAMPLPIQRYDDPFLPYGKAVIRATQDVVCAYIFDLAAYLAIGAPGAVALERTIAFARAGGETVTILHAPFATDDYATAASDEAFAVDAVTLTGDAPAGAYLRLSGMGIYRVSSGTSSGVGEYNAGASLFTYPDNERSLVIQVLDDIAVGSPRGDDFAEMIRAAVEAQRAHG